MHRTTLFLRILIALIVFIAIGKSIVVFSQYILAKHLADPESQSLLAASSLTQGGQLLGKPKIEVTNIQSPGLPASSYLIADIDTRQILAGKEIGSPFPIASLTKLMTALVAIDKIGMTARLPLSKQLFSDGLKDILQVGEKIALKDALHPLLMESSNEAAQTIAEANGKNLFVDWMNDRAQTIGMTDTLFVDPEGMNGKNVSSAADLFMLMSVIRRQSPIIFTITKTPTKQIATKTGTHEVRNINLFEKDSRFLGGKTGYTREARETMVALFQMEIQGENRRLAFILLGSENRAEDMGRLIRWVENATHLKTSENR